MGLQTPSPRGLRDWPHGDRDRVLRSQAEIPPRLESWIHGPIEWKIKIFRDTISCLGASHIKSNIQIELQDCFLRVKGRE